MSEVKCRYDGIVEKFPDELQKQVLRLVGAIIERAREELAVRREDFDKLKNSIAELAQAHYLIHVGSMISESVKKYEYRLKSYKTGYS